MAPQILLSLPFPGSATMILQNSSNYRNPNEILQAVCEYANLPNSFVSSLRLSRSGKPWDGQIENHQVDFITAEVAMRLRGGAPKKRCQHAKNSVNESQCSQPALRLVGDCPHCTFQFCARHRLPEDHACLNMTSCREAAFAKNKAKLESERTVGSKMVGA
ncbi:uncharacterized protein MELLADRAFT_71349 [Melampsora larici-populina 98AG31]|uniref:AN1-type domain-containing protein n=1 Tax=Melampsora larici-populina (strain 98AG31 / pathotype 3-4-7) TaxID=747676 RepID=F4RFM4_MELLP|nr:uncharacterized protein MELLADRAFT_71349 [Melampsora larici-populina 98AG31]EGG08906.1 hypothetical protein MELLADRAFT_71349 [Melampsora larici-populina 98AG31]